MSQARPRHVRVHVRTHTPFFVSLQSSPCGLKRSTDEGRADQSARPPRLCARVYIALEMWKTFLQSRAHAITFQSQVLHGLNPSTLVILWEIPRTQNSEIMSTEVEEGELLERSQFTLHHVFCVLFILLLCPLSPPSLGNHQTRYAFLS